jgi:Zinc finger, C2H2 type
MCDVCGKTFSSNFNLKRHIASKHSNLESEDTSTNDDQSSETAETVSNSTEAENSESNDDESSLDSTDIRSRSQNFFWRNILELAFKNMEDFPESVDELKNVDHFPIFIDSMRKFYKNHKFMQLALERSEIERKLNEYEEALVEKNFSNKDAKELTWDHLKFLFKRLIDRNLDIYNEELKNREDE